VFFEVVGDVGQASSDEVAEDFLVRSRDEKMGGVVVGREDVLRVGRSGEVKEEGKRLNKLR
jgi:hypothetical protein